VGRALRASSPWPGASLWVASLLRPEVEEGKKQNVDLFLKNVGQHFHEKCCEKLMKHFGKCWI
jgi:hypothetical protein